jgi:hypothetical protein
MLQVLCPFAVPKLSAEDAEDAQWAQGKSFTTKVTKKHEGILRAAGAQTFLCASL